MWTVAVLALSAPNSAGPADARLREGEFAHVEVAPMNERIDYSTHILIGVEESGDMTVLAQWPRVPRQADVDRKIQSAGETYVSFVPAPTSIITSPGAAPKKR